MAKLVVMWRAAGLLMAIDTGSIVEVLPPLESRPAPGAPEWVRGLFSYRGALIPLVDANRLLGATPSEDRMANRVMVLRIGNGEADWPIGLWVESVLEMERVDFDAPGVHPGFATETGRIFGPIAQTRWGQVQLVIASQIFTPEQYRIMTERLTEAAA